MKKFTAAMLALILALSLFGCFPNTQPPTTQATPGSTPGADLTETDPTQTTGATAPSEQTEPSETIPPEPHELFDLEEAKGIVGTWRLDVAMSGGLIGIEGFQCDVRFPLLYTFTDYGTMRVRFDEHDLDKSVQEFRQALKDYTVQTMYAEFEKEGMDRQQADDAFFKTYNTTINDYVEKVVDAVDYAALFAMFATDGIYYVYEDTLYSGTQGTTEFEENTFRLEPDQGLLILLGSNMESAWDAMGLQFPVELMKVG